MNCRRMSRLISDGSERPLSLIERVKLGAHLLMCPPCARFRRAVRWLDQALLLAPDDEGLSQEGRDRIRHVLEEAAHEQ